MKWEYDIEVLDHITGPETVVELDAFGKDGWELVQIYSERGMNGGIAYFKRPLKEPPATG